MKKDNRRRLVLTRRPGEGFTVDGPARIVYVRAVDGGVRLAIEADDATRIARDELLQELS